MGVVFESIFKTLFVSQGENEALASQRKVEQSTKAMVAATEKAAGGHKKSREESTKSVTANEKLTATLGELAAAQERSQREQLEQAEAARKQASAADLSTKEGRELRKEQMALAGAHERSAKAAGAAATQLHKQDAAQDATAASSDRLSTSMRKTETSFDRAKSAAKRMFAMVGLGYAAWRGIRKITEETVAFDRSMRNVNSIAQLTPSRLKKVNDQVLQMAGKVAQAPQTLSEGLYDLVSSGFKGAGAMKVLHASAKAATAGLTTTETATATVAAVLNAYHLKAGQAKDVSDVLFRTVDRGVISFEELSGSVGDVLPFASSLGVDLREVGASIATMTKAGIGSSETMTRIKNTMVSLLKPGTALTGAINSLGFESGEALIKQKGFQGSLDALIGTTDGTKASVAALFPNIRALGGVLALTGTNSRAAGKDLKGMADASGAADEAFKEQSKSIGLKWDRLKAQISAVSIEIGEKAIPVVGRFLDILSNDKLSNSTKLTRLSKQTSEVIAEVASRLPKIVEQASPAIAEAGGKLGIALVGGMAKGFARMDMLAKLFTTAAVLRMLGGRGALLIVGRAIGASMGIGVGQGIASSTVAGGAGGAAGGWRGRLAGIGKGATTTLGIGATLWAAGDLPTAFGKAENDPMERLDQLERKAGTVQAKLGGLFDKIPATTPLFGAGKGLAGFLGTDKMGEQGEKAAQLKTILSEINNVGQARAAQLRGEGEELLKNLDLTERQRRSIQATLDAPARATKQRKADTGIADLNSGAITTTRDIEKVVNRTQDHINAGWTKGSEAWRKKTAQNMNAQVRAIKAGMDKSVIATGKGQARIQKILRDRQLIRGEDPVGIARAFAKSWGRAHEITPKQLKRMKQDLAQMPKAAREKAIDSMEALAQGLVKKGKLPEKELTKLTSSLRTRFGKTGKQAFEGLSKGASAAFGALKKSVPDIFKDVSAKAKSGYSELRRASVDGAKASKKPIKGLADDVGTYAQKIKRAITGIPAPMRTAFTTMAADANTASAGFGSSKRVTLGFRGGGRIGRYQDGGLVPAAVSSGELLRYPNGSWATVPGPRVAADNVLTALPPATEVYTDHGQGLLAMGASRTQALDAQLPHFAAGGKVRKPKLGGGSPIGRAAGQAGIDSVHKAAVAWVKKQATAAEGVGNLDGKRVANWIIPILTWARGAGWGGSVSSGFRSFAEQTTLWNNRASNPYPVARPGTSNHEGSKYPRGAVDVSDYSGLNALVRDKRGPAPGKLKWYGPGDAVHFSGTGHRRGGIIPSFGAGGVMSPYQVASVAQKANWQKNLQWLVTAISGGESGWNPKTHNTSGEDSRGLMQINVGPGANPQYKSKDLFDPLVNMRVAKRIWKANGGFNPWTVYTSGRYQDFAARSRAAVRRLRKYGPAGGPGDGPPRKAKKVTDDLKPMPARAARRAMPRLTTGHDRGAFGAAMEAGRITGEIRRNAVKRALVKTNAKKAKSSGGGSSGGGSRSTRIRKMQRFGDRVSAKGMSYQYGGGHGTIGKGDPSYDCSGYVSGILGAGGFINQPMAVAQGSGLYTLGKAGSGKQITWGVRGSSGRSAHTMIRVGSKYYESGSGHGPKRVSGWSGAFAKRHFKGWASGTGPHGLRGRRPKRKRPKFGTGAFAAQVIDGIGAGTGRQLGKIYRAGNLDNDQVKKALTTLGRQLSRVGRFSVDRLMKLQKSVKATIRATIDPRSPGGRRITKAEAALIRRSRSIIDLTQGALGAKAGRHVKQANRLASRAEQRQFNRDLRLRRRGVDPASSEGIRFETETVELELASDRQRRRQLKKALAIAKRAGDKGAIQKITGQLKEVNNEIVEGVVSRIEHIRERIRATVEEGRTRTDSALAHVDLWDRSLAASQRSRGIADSPEAMLEQATGISAKVSQYQRQRDQAAAAAAEFAKRGMMAEAREQISTWHEAVVAIAEATADEVELRRGAALGAAQRATDRVGGVSALQSIFLERVELEQRLAGTYESGAMARRDFILANIVPALNAEIEAMAAQLQVVIDNGDEEQVRQQNQAIEQKRNELLQAQLNAQEQIAENTDPRSIGGALAFQYGGENLTDQLLLGANGI